MHLQQSLSICQAHVYLNICVVPEEFKVSDEADEIVCYEVMVVVIPCRSDNEHTLVVHWLAIVVRCAG